MRVFSHVIEEGSFAGAARRLRLSAAVVTRLVADLEAHLGARLIHRTTRRLALTDTGELYLDRVRQILCDVEEAEALAATAACEPRGHLRVLAPPAFAVHQLVKRLPAFRARHPRITLELSSAGPGASGDEACDVSVIQVAGREPLDGDFVARLLAHSEVIACAAPGYLDRHGRPAHPGDLAAHETLLPGSARESTFHRAPQRENDPAGEAVRFAPARRGLAAAHGDTLHAAARAGLGIAGLPSYMVEEGLLDRTLERVLPEWNLSTLRLYAATPAHRHVPTRARVFVDFLLQALGGDALDPWLRAANRGEAKAGA